VVVMTAKQRETGKMTEFQGFNKIARFSRLAIVTEKIDGTNAQIYIGKDGEFLTGSRNRWITPEDDNHGFSAWAHANKDELMKLGPGRHFGEWWGKGIQRGYGLKEKRFSLFNTERWLVPGDAEDGKKQHLPECCRLVPILWEGWFDELDMGSLMSHLSRVGSYAAQGFMQPEGIVIFHTAANVSFKKTFSQDEGKGNG